MVGRLTAGNGPVNKQPQLFRRSNRSRSATRRKNWPLPRSTTTSIPGQVRASWLLRATQRCNGNYGSGFRKSMPGAAKPCQLLVSHFVPFWLSIPTPMPSTSPVSQFVSFWHRIPCSKSAVARFPTLPSPESGRRENLVAARHVFGAELVIWKRQNDFQHFERTPTLSIAQRSRCPTLSEKVRTPRGVGGPSR